MNTPQTKRERSEWIQNINSWKTLGTMHKQQHPTPEAWATYQLNRSRGPNEYT